MPVGPPWMTTSSGYSDRLAAGVVAGGGPLGIMIPPSTIMVIYGVFTETNIGRLFAAGITPVIICAIYVILGTAMEELSMILLTIPVFFPVIVHLGFDPVWFGIIIVCVVEIGLISPPVGMNMFVLRTLLPEVSTSTVFSGVLPFMWADVIRLAILVAFPWLALWLPSMMR